MNCPKHGLSANVAKLIMIERGNSCYFQLIISYYPAAIFRIELVLT